VEGKDIVALASISHQLGGLGHLRLPAPSFFTFKPVSHLGHASPTYRSQLRTLYIVVGTMILFLQLRICKLYVNQTREL
jgi:hypothetical protein